MLEHHTLHACERRNPAFVVISLNACYCRQGGWAAPGAISAATIISPLQTSTPASTLGSAATSAPTHLASNALLPLSYWYGHAETRRIPLLMDRLIRNLGENVWERLDGDMEGGSLSSVSGRVLTSHSWSGRVSGLIVDTPSSFAASSSTGSDHRHGLIKACVDAFRSENTSAPGPKSTTDTRCCFSQRHPRRGPRKTQCGDAADVRQPHSRGQDSEIWRRKCRFVRAPPVWGVTRNPLTHPPLFLA